MEKRISFYEFQSVKRVAQACDPLIKKRERVKSQIEKLAEEYKSYDMQIKSLEAGITKVLGLGIEDLVKKIVEPDAKGNKVAKYLPTEKVRYDDTAKQYVINMDNSEPAVASEPQSDAEVNTPTSEEPMEGSTPVDPFEAVAPDNSNFPFD